MVEQTGVVAITAADVKFVSAGRRKPGTGDRRSTPNAQRPAQTNPSFQAGPRPKADFLLLWFAKSVAYPSRSIAAGGCARRSCANVGSPMSITERRTTLPDCDSRPKPLHRFTEPNAFQFRPRQITTRAEQPAVAQALLGTFVPCSQIITQNRQRQQGETHENRLRPPSRCDVGEDI